MPNLDWLKPTNDLQYVLILGGAVFLSWKYLPLFLSLFFKSKKPKLEEEDDHKCHQEAVLSNMDERFTQMEKTQIEIQASLKSLQHHADQSDDRLAALDKKLDTILLYMATGRSNSNDSVPR